MTHTDIDVEALEDDAFDARPDAFPILTLRRQASGTYRLVNRPVHTLPTFPGRFPTELDPSGAGLGPAPGGGPTPGGGPLPGPLPRPFPQPAPLPVPEPLPLPEPFPRPAPLPVPVDRIPLPFLLHEELRVDVDGTLPQMTVSATSTRLLQAPRTWIARVRRLRSPADQWLYSGEIWYTDGQPGGRFRYDRVQVTVVPPTFFGTGGSATVRLTGPGGADLVRHYAFVTRRFRSVELELDATSDADVVTEIATHDHPDRPATLPNENLSIATVFTRSGFAVTQSALGDVPLSGAGTNTTWSDAEMHDAMQTYWSRFQDAPQWAMWTFWARLHDTGTSLGGVMFDDIGPNHRQGTAIFSDSFISTAPNGDAAPDAWVRRMRFWTAVHEMGHSFNLAHSWQKDLPNFGTPWIPLANEPEARSFMNYPYFVSGGVPAFFGDFAYRFSDTELVFLRHAPYRFVQPGNADWFDHHNVEQGEELRAATGFRLEVRANRPVPRFAFLEPVVLELKLTNTGDEPRIVRDDVLAPERSLTVMQRHGHDARQWTPYAHRCTRGTAVVLMPGESLYAPLPVFAGTNGWDVSEPGTYTVVSVAEVDGVPVAAAPLTLRVDAPASDQAERIAPDVLTEGVGRALAFGGTVVDQGAADSLHEAVEALPGSRIAIHAAAALAAPLARDFKVLDIPPDVHDATTVGAAGGSVATHGPEIDEALAVVAPVLGSEEAAETLGHIGTRRFVEAFADDVAAAGATDAAAGAVDELAGVLDRRGVLPSVVASVTAKAAAYGDDVG